MYYSNMQSPLGAEQKKIWEIMKFFEVHTGDLDFYDTDFVFRTSEWGPDSRGGGFKK